MPFGFSRLSTFSSAEFPVLRVEGLMRTSCLGLNASKSFVLRIVQLWVSALGSRLLREKTSLVVAELDADL